MSSRVAAPGCEVWFYHLERSPLEAVLPELLEKVLGRGWKALVRTSDEARAQSLNETLWTWRDDAFLPHGLAGEAFAERQPVLLGSDGVNANGAQALFLIDAVEGGSLAGYARCLVLFDGRDEAALARARAGWRLYKGEGHPVSYWRQGEARGWEKQA